MIRFPIKQGETFLLGVTYTPGTGEASPVGAACDIKTMMGAPVASVPLASTGTLVWQGGVSAADTAAWLLGDCISDIRFTFADGSDAITETFHLNVIPAVTNG